MLCAVPAAAMAAPLPVAAVAAVCSPDPQPLMFNPEAPVVAGLDEAGEPAVEVSGNVVQVTGGQGLMLEVYDITGKRVTTVRIDSNDKRVTLNLRKGCYIIKVGKLTRKVAVS